MRVSSHVPGSRESRIKWPDGATHEHTTGLGRVRFVRLIRTGASFSIVSMWLDDKKKWKSQNDTVDNKSLKLIGL